MPNRRICLAVVLAVLWSTQARGGDDQSAEPQSGLATQLGLSTVARQGDRTLFMLDVSGSMAIGERWSHACAAITELAEQLGPKARFDVMLFGSQVRSLHLRSWKRPDAGKLRMLANRLDAAHPELEHGTSLWRAVGRALARRPQRIVLLTDGVDTTSAAGVSLEVLDDLRRVQDRGLRLDVIAVQDGVYPAEGDGRLENGRLALQTLATAGGGLLVALEAEPRDASSQDGTVGHQIAPPSIELIDARTGQLVPPEMLTAFPQLFVRVLDPIANAGGFADIAEYGGAARLDIVVYCPDSDEIVAQALSLPLRRHGRWLVTAQVIEFAGPQDSRHGRASANLRRRLIEAHFGSRVEIIYHRAGKPFSEERYIDRWD